MVECVGIATRARLDAQSLWLADGTNYPGQDDLRARRRAAARLPRRSVYAALPAEQELLVEYKLFEPAFYATDLADWGSALLVCQKLGERAKVLVDLGHHAQGTNIEQIVALARRGGPARRLPLQQPQVRRRRPDRRLGQPVRAVPDLRRAGRAAATLPRLTIDQSHNVEAKVEAMVLSVVNLQEAYAKALLVDRAALRAAPGGRRRARRPRAAARRLPHRRPPAVREGARRRWAPPRTRSPRSARRGYAERVAAEREPAAEPELTR